MQSHEEHGMNIAEYLKHAGMTPETFGKLIGVHGGTVRRWIKGGSIKSVHMDAMIRVTHGLITGQALLKKSAA